MRKVKVKLEDNTEVIGIFHQWSTIREEHYDDGDKMVIHQYPVAIVELKDGVIGNFPVKDIRFIYPQSDR